MMTLLKKITPHNTDISICCCVNIMFPLIILVISGTVMTGWITHSLALIQIIPNLFPMQFNTALLFFALACALIALHKQYLMLCKCIAAAVGIIALVTVLQTLFRMDFGVDTLFLTPFDTLFLTPFDTLKLSHIGRMSLSSAGSFTLISLSLLLFPQNHTISKLRTLIISLLISISFVFSTVTLIGYLIGIGDAYIWDPDAQMSILAASCFIMTGVTIISCTWSCSIKEHQWLPLPIYISLITIIICVSVMFYTKEIINMKLEFNNCQSISSNWMILSLGLFISYLLILCIDLAFKSRSQTHELNENKELYRMIIESIEDYAIFMLTPEGKISSWNKGAERINGYTKEEIIGKHFSILYTKADIDKEIPNKVLTATLQRGKYISEGLRERKDGTQFWTSSILESLYDDNNLIGLLKIEHDISKQKKHEAELKASEDSFRAAMQYAPIGMALISLNRQWIKVNPAVCNIVGYTESELLATDYRTITHPEDVYNDASLITQILNQEIKSYSIEKRYLHKNGQIILASVQVSLAWNADGTPKYFIVQLQDITERRLLEQSLIEREKALVKMNKQLTESEKFQHLITESIPDIVFVKDAHFQIVEANSSFFNLYPQSMRHKLIGTTAVEEYTEAEKEHFFKKDKEALEQGRSETIETIQAPDGRVKTLHTHKIRFYNDAGEAFIMGIARDITEREELIQKLLESNTELERFAYVASHDLQEPIRMITNFSHIVATLHKEKLDKEGITYLRIIEEAGARMNAIIKDLLDYSRINNQSEQFTLFDGAEILQNTLENINILIQEKNPKITYDHLPQLYGNPIQIMRVIQNLIINGIKYQPQGNVPHIHIGIEEEINSWHISVKDNGIGIESQFLKEIFEPFRRLHTWNSIKGTGIGLSICKKIIENHHGKLWATSVLGKGSTFIFTLPKKPS